MDENSEVAQRTFDEPTLEDKFNRESLPKILQVKNFGKRSRTKYTHLVDQDTTQYRDALRDDRILKKLKALDPLISKQLS